MNVQLKSGAVLDIVQYLSENTGFAGKWTGIEYTFHFEINGKFIVFDSNGYHAGICSFTIKLSLIDKCTMWYWNFDITFNDADMDVKNLDVAGIHNGIENHITYRLYEIAIVVDDLVEA